MKRDVQVNEGLGPVENVDIYCHYLRTRELPTRLSKTHRTELILDFQLFWLMDMAREKFAPLIYQTVDLLNVFTTRKQYGIADPFPPPAGSRFFEADITSVADDGFSVITVIIDHVGQDRHIEPTDYGLDPVYDDD